MRQLIASETSSNDRWIPAIVVLMTWMVFRRWWCQSVDSHSTYLGNMSGLTLAIKYVKHSQAMFVSPASTHPFNVVERTQALCNERSFGMSWELVMFLMLALYTVRLLVEAACCFWRLCPTQKSNQESERKFLEAGGQHFMTITL